MNYRFSLLFLLMAVSCGMTFITESYAMSIVFVSTTFLLGFLAHSEKVKEIQLQNIEKRLKDELNWVEEKVSKHKHLTHSKFEDIQREMKEMNAKLDKASFARLKG